ncbi:MAG: zinc-ribbon domain-containing protein [Candidatus Korobacteraceae bacterium]|jgi:RNA polymerase subunit RPABC4/transcription elongation factor Spt4
MNQAKSHFRSELAIIPPVARVIAVLVFVVMQICLLVLVPHFVHDSDVPPMPALVAISLVGGFIVAVIVLMIGYVYADSKRRGMNALLWTLLVIFVPKALGFIAYFLLRKPLLIPCPNCGTEVGSDFRYCPKCGHALTPTCSHCGRSISGDYVCCPYCGKPVAATATT